MPSYDITWTEKTVQTARFDLDEPLPPDHGGYTGNPDDDAHDQNWNVARMAQPILDAILNHDVSCLDFGVEERYVTDVTEVPPEPGVQATSQQAALEAAGLDIHVNDHPEPGVVVGHRAGPSRPLTATETRHLASVLIERADHLDATLAPTTPAGTRHERRGA